MISDSERAQRARRFLGILLERDHWPAGHALQDVLKECDKPEDVPDELCAALDRALVAWAVEVMDENLREAGLELFARERGQAGAPRRLRIEADE